MGENFSKIQEKKALILDINKSYKYLLMDIGMKLESLLKPIKWADEQVLRQYTKASQKLHLEKGRRKYFVAEGLRFAGFMTFPLGSPGKGEFLGAAWVYQLPDGAHNLLGIEGGIEDEVVSDTIAVNPVNKLLNLYNSLIRLPTFAAGVGLVGKFGVDLVRSLSGDEPLNQGSYDSLREGLSLLCWASSMYIKYSDPKVLEKATLREKAYNWIKSKIESLTPAPIPEPSPGYSINYSQSQ